MFNYYGGYEARLKGMRVNYDYLKVLETTKTMVKILFIYSFLKNFLEYNLVIDIGDEQRRIE
jgi:hypothetical protein